MAELSEDESGPDVVTDTPRPSRLNSAAPDFIPKQQETPKPQGSLPRVSIDRTYSRLDTVNFSPANGVCTPTSQSCWVWDSATQGWYLSPHYVKGGSPASGNWSPASVLAPMTPQQGSAGGFLQQHSDGSCSDGGLASDGSSMSGGSSGGPSSGGPGTPLVWHQHYLTPHHRSPFYWQPCSGRASPTAMAPLTPMAFPPHPAMQHHGHMPHEQMHLAHPGMHHGHMPLEQPQAHSHMLPQPPHPGMFQPLVLPPPQQEPPQQPGLAPHTPGFQPQTPTMHGGPPPPPHGLQPVGIPLPPQFYGPPLQSPSPAYMRQAGTPCLWQEQGRQWVGWQQPQGFGTPTTAPRRTSRFSSGSQNASPNPAPPTPRQLAAEADTAALPPLPPLRKRAPLQEMQQCAVLSEAGSCSPTRKASGISAADNQQIAAVLARAAELGEDVPKEVETLTALMTTEGKEPLNARQRRTLRRAMERALKVMGLGPDEDAGSSDSSRSVDGACASPRKPAAAPPANGQQLEDAPAAGQPVADKGVGGLARMPLLSLLPQEESRS